MTATAPRTAAEATPMAHTPDNRPDPPAEAIAAEPAAAGTQSRRWAILGDNPQATVAPALLTVMGAVVVALLMLMFNSINSRIDRLEGRVVALEAKMDRRFAEQDAKIDEINLKLTALIAALNKTDEVDAAIEGRLLDSEPGGAPG